MGLLLRRAYERQIQKYGQALPHAIGSLSSVKINMAETQLTSDTNRAELMFGNEAHKVKLMGGSADHSFGLQGNTTVAHLGRIFKNNTAAY